MTITNNYFSWEAAEEAAADMKKALGEIQDRITQAASERVDRPQAVVSQIEGKALIDIDRIASKAAER